MKNSTVPVGVAEELDPAAATVAVSVIVWPEVNEVGDALRVVVDARLTVAVTAGEVLAVKLLSPVYSAVIELLPWGKRDVLSVATPPLRVPVPRSVVPLKNSTEPVGVPEPGLTAATVAVSVTVGATVDGFGSDRHRRGRARLADVYRDGRRSARREVAVALVGRGERGVGRGQRRGVSVAMPLRSAVPCRATLVPLKNSTEPVGVPAAGADLGDGRRECHRLARDDRACRGRRESSTSPRAGWSRRRRRAVSAGVADRVRLAGNA